MSNKINKDFYALVNDEEFITLIQNAPDKEKLFSELKIKYPNDLESLTYAFEFIVENSKDNIKLESEDYDEILNNIIAYAKSVKSIKSRKLFFEILWKAAVVIFILSLGGVVFYNSFKKNPIEQFALSEVEEENRGMIVLSDGSKEILEDNDSYIEYNTEEDAIIVSKDNKQHERINKPKNRKVLNQIVVPYGQTHTVALSDGTIVKLNAGSRLTFPAKFKGATREVYLKGEGFFDVKENKEKPFKVMTEHINVEVLGTKFNMSAYSDEEKISTVLVEGKVKVTQKEKRFANKEVVISPGQGYFYSINSEKSTVQVVDVENYISWKDGWFKFKDMSLLEITTRLKKYYNKTIEIEDNSLASTKVCGKLLLSDDFAEVLQSLAFTVEGSCKITDDGKYYINY